MNYIVCISLFIVPLSIRANNTLSVNNVHDFILCTNVTYYVVNLYMHKTLISKLYNVVVPIIFYNTIQCRVDKQK